MKLFQSNPRTQSCTPIRLQNHILEQIIIDRVLLQLARNAPQMAQRNRPVRAPRKQLIRRLDLRGSGIIILRA